MPITPGLRLLAVHAHPDDESSKGAAVSARYVAEGAEVTVVSCTGGERGDVLNPALKDDPHILRDIAQVRRDEMAAAARILGVRHVWLGFVDSGFPEGDPVPPLPDGCFGLEPLDVTTEALVRVIREVRPHVMTTYDERGGYPHPDHVMTHRVSMAAFLAAADPEAFPHAGTPWQPLKLYYNQTFSKDRIVAFHEALLAEGLPSPYGEWLANWPDRPSRTVTTQVNCADYLQQRDDALRAHATQIDPEGTFFAVPHELQRRVWPHEDFELALSYVPVSLPEGELFDGIDDVAAADALATAGTWQAGYDGRVAVEQEADA